MRAPSTFQAFPATRADYLRSRSHGSLSNLFWRAGALYRQSARRAQDRESLLRLTERELHHMRLTRIDVVYLASLPLWRPLCLEGRGR